MNIAYIDFSIATKSLDVFFAGCKGAPCKDCCNPELLQFSNGTDWELWLSKIEDYLLQYGSLIDNIFLVGGSPNHQDIDKMTSFLEHIYKYSKDIWLFSREELEDVYPIFKEKCSYIKCGAYIPELSCSNNIVYGIDLATSNQKIYRKGEGF